MASGPQRRLWKKRNRSDIDAFGSQAVSVAAAVSFQQAVPFEFAQIVAELIEAIGLRGKLERGEDRLVNVLRGPATDGVAAVQQNFQ